MDKMRKEPLHLEKETCLRETRMKWLSPAHEGFYKTTRDDRHAMQLFRSKVVFRR